MLKLEVTSQFKKDLKKAKKQRKNIEKLNIIVLKLRKNEKLLSRNKEHRLTGNWNAFFECHIEPDWLLIYYKTKDRLILERTGSHSELFK